MVLFICLHGSAKSLIAATHWNRLAESRGVALRAESAGAEPDAEVPSQVVHGLAGDGIDVRGYRPGRATAARIRGASHVVSFGCGMASVAPVGQVIERWDDLPMVSDGYEIARDAIVARVEQLLDATLTQSKSNMRGRASP